MKRVGQILKEAREKKGVTVNEVALVTKINAKTIEAIERGEAGGLPQKAFVRGFVQTYSKYLGLNVQDMLTLFQEEMGMTRPDLPTAASTTSGPSTDGESPQLKSGGRKSSGSLSGIDETDPRRQSRNWILGGALVALLIGIGVVIQVIQKYERESQAPPPEAIATIVTPSSTAIGLPPDTGATTTTTFIPGQGAVGGFSFSVTSSTVPTSSTTLFLTTSTSTSTVSSSSTTTSSSSTTTSSRVPVTKTSTTQNITSTTLKPKKEKLEIMIEALDNVTVEYSIDAGILQSIKLSPEQVHSFKALSSLTLNISDGGAVNVIHNGLDKGVPGSLGKPVKLKFP